MAGLISQQFIDELLERSDIIDVVGARISLKKSGQNYTALCPFHQEKSPSFSVNQEKQFYYCFGCGAGGNSIQFIMDFDRVDFPQSVESLARNHGLEIVHEKPSSPEAQKIEQKQRAIKHSVGEIMEQIAQFFQQQLRTPAGQHALEYVQQRGLKESTLESFELGFAPDANNTLLQKFGHNDEALEVLKQTGMLVENDNGQIYDRFRNRLMFPIRDRRGKVVSFGGRTLNNAKAKYLNGPETAIFHKSQELYGLYQARQQRGEPEFMLICEGYMDVIALHQHNIHNAVATLGTATNEQHLNILFRYCPNLIFSFDGDKAGQRAAQRAFQILLPLLEDGLRANFLFIPEGEDPDSIVNQQGESAFRVLAKNAMTFSDYFFNTLLPESQNIKDVGVKARLSKQAMELIQKIPGKAYQALLLQELQLRTGLSQQILNELKGDIQQESHHVSSDRTSAPPPSKRAPLRVSDKKLQLTTAKRALSIILNYPELALPISIQDIPSVQLDEMLLVQVIEHIQSHPEHSNHRLMGHWMNSPDSDLIMRLLADGAERQLTSEACASELQDCLQHLHTQHEKYAQRQRIANMSQAPNKTLEELDPELRQQIIAIQNLYKDKPSDN